MKHCDKKALLQLLSKFQNLYAHSDSETGSTNLVTHKIHTGDHLPIRKPAFRMAPKEKEIIADELRKMEGQNIIRKSNSPWCTNIVLVKKKRTRRLEYAWIFED